MTILLSRIVPRDRLVAVHAPLGEVEWPGTVEHIQATLPGGVPLILAPVGSPARPCSTASKNAACGSRIRFSGVPRISNPARSCASCAAISRPIPATAAWSSTRWECEPPRAPRARSSKLGGPTPATARRGGSWFDWLPIHGLATAGRVPRHPRGRPVAPLGLCRRHVEAQLQLCILASRADLRRAPSSALASTGSTPPWKGASATRSRPRAAASGTHRDAAGPGPRSPGARGVPAAERITRGVVETRTARSARPPRSPGAGGPSRRRYPPSGPIPVPISRPDSSITPVSRYRRHDVPVHVHVGGELLFAPAIVPQALRAHGACDGLDVVGRTGHDRQRTPCPRSSQLHQPFHASADTPTPSPSGGRLGRGRWSRSPAP